MIKQENEKKIKDSPVRINIIINDNFTPYLKYVDVIISNKITMRELLSQSINMFNDKFLNEGLPFELSQDVSSYVLKPSKKSGNPDTDLPSK